MDQSPSTVSGTGSILLLKNTSAGFLTFSPSNHLFRAHKWSGLSHGLVDVYGPLDGAAALSFLCCSHAGTHQSTLICVACAKAILGSRLESFVLVIFLLPYVPTATLWPAPGETTQFLVVRSCHVDVIWRTHRSKSFVHLPAVLRQIRRRPAHGNAISEVVAV